MRGRWPSRSPFTLTPNLNPNPNPNPNPKQVVIALAGGEVIYFELDASGALAELGTKELGVEVACLDVGVVPAGRARAPFLALGGWDGSLRLLSLAPDELLVQVATMQLGARAESVPGRVGTSGREAGRPGRCTFADFRCCSSTRDFASISGLKVHIATSMSKAVSTVPVA